MFRTLLQRMRPWCTSRRMLILGCIVVCVVGAAYLFKAHGLSLSPVDEAMRMERLEETAHRVTLTPFVSDGCSGNVSALWTTVVTQMSDLFPEVDARYYDVERIPFEVACEAHDQLYWKGEGGYVGRLRADNALRSDILAYGVTHAEEIARRAQLMRPESAIYLYEVMAELVYRGVRLGGAPCSGKPYAWGYGYGQGACDISE